MYIYIDVMTFYHESWFLSTFILYCFSHTGEGRTTSSVNSRLVIGRQLELQTRAMAARRVPG